MLLQKMDTHSEYMFLQYYFTLSTVSEYMFLQYYFTLSAVSDRVSLLLEHYVRVHEAD